MFIAVSGWELGWLISELFMLSPLMVSPVHELGDRRAEACQPRASFPWPTGLKERLYLFISGASVLSSGSAGSLSLEGVLILI